MIRGILIMKMSSNLLYEKQDARFNLRKGIL